MILSIGILEGTGNIALRLTKIIEVFLKQFFHSFKGVRGLESRKEASIYVNDLAGNIVRGL
jgi:hypothetical protein